ncbi:MAG TPA: 2-oxoacid:acceptor oxidoreductase subunit alpha [Thermoplasmata archaeon]|nr:2-oxoacid:acceptor oxidoreductase subunit alpha [Thermoplasmata archaeon]
MSEISVRTGGAAGDGIASVGEVLGKALSRMGLHVFGLNAYQSVIRGGHVWFQARASSDPIHSQGDQADVLFALNKETAQMHAPSMSAGSTIVYDPEKFDLAEGELPVGTKKLAVPTLEIGRKYSTQSILQNAAGMGATAFLAGIPFPVLQTALADSFGRKKGDVADWNIGAAGDGYAFAEKHAGANDHAVKPVGAPKLLMTGNAAIALGAAAAGCKFLVQYPMTPASTILHWMAAHSRQLGIVVKQAEDEIAVVNMAIGASYAGVRSMCATSGGGFALMVEGIGMAGMTETPLVVVESQRSGPSTGLPTKTEQGDLNMMLGAGQGDFPRAILAPSDAGEAFRATVKAFQLAEDWQTPILIASDFHLSESIMTVERDELPFPGPLPSLFTVEPNGGEYKRYAYTDSGVSPRALPGQPGLQFKAGSDEHDERGRLISDVLSGVPIWVAERTKMMDKRMRKLEGLRAAGPAPSLEGPAGAPLTFVAWGSTVGAVRDATRLLTAQGIVTNRIQIPQVFPLATSVLVPLLSGAKRTLLVEANYTGQLGHLLRAETGIAFPNRFLKYDGEPFTPQEIAQKAREVLNHGQ